MRKLLVRVKNHFVMIVSIFSAFLSACGISSHKHLYGNKLLKLSDSKLFETVYFQMLDLVESFPDEDIALSEMSAAQKTVYILSIFDMEIQNGGLCQFFVNPSRSLAPDVGEYLEIVGAEEHRQLFEEFASENQLDLTDLTSFEITDVEEFATQTERYPFDDFDNAYCELQSLQDYIVAYIRDNIEEF